MPSANRNPDSLPDEFKSYEEAAQFWDAHSITDYEEFMEPVDLEVDIQRHHFEIEVDEESFLALRETAKKEQKAIKELASEILKQRLRAG
ncbi:MAG TPA: CopG family antitoxin [Sedimentisphaerales bacterium]|nr:CopG family antitoxin [Sedimentisphaerales bacterium]